MFNMYRIGIGKDIHKLKENIPLILGGVKIPYFKGLSSFSDGDVVIHSLVDAMLGAISKGDIGQLFPNNDEINKNRPSKEFLEITNSLIKEEGYTINNIDIIIACEKPKLKDYILTIRQSLASILSINVSKISVKATTNEGLDSIGRNESIEATSIVLLKGETYE